MNIHVNLLPEARILKLKDTAKRRRYATIAGLTGGIILATIIVFGMLQIFLISTYAVNENKIKTITKEQANLKEMEQNAATLQANLASFYKLNENRTYASRVFTNLAKATPSGITVSNFQISSQDQVTISGTAGSFAEVASFAKSLEEYNVNYLPQQDLERKPIFSNVVISSVSKDSNSNKVNYTITFKADIELLKKQKSES